MKNLSNLKFLLVFLFAAFTNYSVIFAAADDPIPTLGAVENRKGFAPVGSGLYEFYPENCATTTIKFGITLTNLTGEGSIPQGYPRMFLRYTIYGLSEIVELDGFTQYGSVTNGQTKWVLEVESLPFDITEQCSYQANGTYFTMPFALELLEPIYGLTPGGAVVVIGYQQYPACEYAADGEIFSCTFHNNGCCETAIGCSAGGVCVPDEMIFFESELQVYCDECPPVGKGQPYNDENDSSENLAPYLVANPNPFNDYMEVYWSDNNQVEGMELYDINGKLYQSWGKAQVSDTNGFNINTVNLAKGVYFIKVQFEDSMEILKVVKQ